MVMGEEFGGLKPGDDNPQGAGHGSDADSHTTADILRVQATDHPPVPDVPQYLATQQKLTSDANDLLNKFKAGDTSAGFVDSFMSYLDKEANLGGQALVLQQFGPPQAQQGLKMNLATQILTGVNAQKMQEQGRPAVEAFLKNPASQPAVEAFLQQQNWAATKH